MDVLALFSDKTAQKIIIDKVPHKKEESSLILRIAISNEGLKYSVECCILNTYNFLLTMFPNNTELLKPIPVCIRGFSGDVSGESAELAFSIAFISHLIKTGVIFSKKEIHSIAATGTINDRFEVEAVNSLKEKLIAANNNSVELMIYPWSNSKEINELLEKDEDIRKLDLYDKLFPVATLKDVFDLLELTDIKPEESINRAVPVENRKGLFFAALSLALIVISISVLGLYKMSRTINSDQIPALGNTLFSAHEPTNNKTGILVHTKPYTTPDIKTPDIKTPDIKTPDIKTPDTKTPDTKTTIAPDITKSIVPSAAATSKPFNKLLILDDRVMNNAIVKRDEKSNIFLSEARNGHTNKALQIKYSLSENEAVSVTYNLQDINKTIRVKDKRIRFYYKGSTDSSPNSFELRLTCIGSNRRSFYYTINNATKVDSRLNNTWIPIVLDFEDFNPRLSENDISNLQKIEFIVFNDPIYGDRAGEGVISVCDFEIT